MEIINREQLVHELNVGRPIVVEVLAPNEYDDYHLPRAINIPLGERFDRHIRSVVPENDTRLVVYCQDAGCPVSRRAAERLEEIGYTNVADYAAGKEDWRRAGLPVR